MAQAAPKDDRTLLNALALAMVKQPKASLNELAEAVGIGRMTLYRFAQTREALIERLFEYGISVIEEDLQAAGLDATPPLKALHIMTERCLEHREISQFMIRYCCHAEHEFAEDSIDWDSRMDAFFLRGQQEGIFRIDLPAAVLNEIWTALLLGLVDAEYRGRVARAGLADLIERAFMQGAMPPAPLKPTPKSGD